VTAPADPAGYTEVSFDEPSDPVVVTSLVDDRVPAMYYVDGSIANPDHAGREWQRHHETPTAPTRIAVVQPRRRLDRRIGCGGSPRTRRTTTSSTSRGDPALAGDDPPRHQLLACLLEGERVLAPLIGGRR
jgi:hypothetical protein